MTIIRSNSATATPEEYLDQFASEDQKNYSNSTYAVVSTVAYLIGVPKRIFELEYEPPKMETYEKLDKDKNARIIRNLCMLRTAIERNFGNLNREMTYNVKNLYSFPEWIPQDSLAQLERDGIIIVKANRKLNQYIMDINGHITNRINNCKALFPIWLEWNYIKALFIMPNGMKESGIKTAANEYYANKARYPYQVYINWWYKENGNILFNDKKFVTLLYEANEDRFNDLSKVSDASDLTKESIYDFLEDNDQVVIMVDCENSDPFKLYATLNNLNQEALLNRISKIILCDDVNTTTAWDILDQFTNLPVDHWVIPRIADHKSIVDQSLCVKVCMEHYENGVNAIILFGSDSDYWGLYGLLKNVDYYVMVEESKFGHANKAALMDAGIPFCYIDDFCTGNSNQIKVQAMLREVRKSLDNALKLNVKEMLQEAYRATRADMSQAERKQFYDRYIKTMRLVIADDGEVTIALEGDNFR